MKEIHLMLKNEAQMQHLGAVFSIYVKKGLIFLSGELGAGKTSFCQALIRSAGFKGRVKSPTYTLLEPYELEDRNIYHFDLYRLQDEEELLFLGCDEYFEASSGQGSEKRSSSLCLVEWPEKACSVLPSADIEIRIQHHQAESRQVNIKAFTRYGEQVLNAMQIELQGLS